MFHFTSITVGIDFFLNLAVFIFSSRRLQTWVLFLPLMCCGLKVEKGEIITTHSEAVTGLLHIRGWTCPPFLPNSSGQMSLTSALTWGDQLRICGDFFAVFLLRTLPNLTTAVHNSYWQAATRRLSALLRPFFNLITKYLVFIFVCTVYIHY